jgi:hypothetical protein
MYTLKVYISDMEGSLTVAETQGEDRQDLWDAVNVFNAKTQNDTIGAILVNSRDIVVMRYAHTSFNDQIPEIGSKVEL